MATKRGKGGYGSENYDPETGQYIKEDNKYHAGAGISVAEILRGLKAGEYDDDQYQAAPFFANDNDEELEEDEELWKTKSDLVSYLQEWYDQQNTEQVLMNTNMPEITQQEFSEYGKQCEEATSLADRGAFYNGYRGAGQACFEFNKALRFGFNQFYKAYPQFKYSPNLNPEAITDRAKKLDNLTNSWEFPENKKVIRFVDTAPLISWFESSGIFDGMNLYTNEYNIKMLQEGYDKQELANRLKALVGTKVPPDGSFTSFSCMSDASHMAKNLDNNKRSILIRYNVRKGTKAWISQYGYESEGLFNRKTGFVVQGANLETFTDDSGRKWEVIVLEYGIQ